MNFAVELSPDDIERIADAVATRLAALSQRPEHETMPEACARLKCTVRNGRRLAATGRIRTAKIGRKVLVVRSSVDRLLEEGAR